MFLTPLLFIVFDRVVTPRYAGAAEEREPDTVDELGTVVIAGIGRFGQIVNRLLTANGVKTVVLDRQVGQIENMRRIEMKSYFADATRPDLLHTAGIDEASLFVIAIDERDQAVELVRYAKERHPHVRVLVRAFDRGHEYRLCEAGADYAVRETYYSALELGTEALRDLGVHPFKAEQLRATFEAAEDEVRGDLYEAWKRRPEGNRVGSDFRALFIRLNAAMAEAMKADRDDRHSRAERGWTPPPKEYAAAIEAEIRAEEAAER